MRHPTPSAHRPSRQHAAKERPPFECIALLLQGGGALGAYQGGVYQALAEANIYPDWIAGISIGAINSALIAGNAPEQRVEKMRAFWESISIPQYVDVSPYIHGDLAHGMSEAVAGDVEHGCHGSHTCRPRDGAAARPARRIAAGPPGGRPAAVRESTAAISRALARCASAPAAGRRRRGGRSAAAAIAPRTARRRRGSSC